MPDPDGDRTSSTCCSRPFLLTYKMLDLVDQAATGPSVAHVCAFSWWYRSQVLLRNLASSMSLSVLDSLQAVLCQSGFRDAASHRFVPNYRATIMGLNSCRQSVA